MAMIKFKDLNLRKLIEDCGIDFAHYTYTANMCSCCYGPTDMSARYWAGKTMKERESRRENAKETRDYTYILFKNANNGCGIVNGDDYVCSAYHNNKKKFWTPNNSMTECVSWRLPDDKLDKVCEWLQGQLGEGYEVVKPTSRFCCIEIKYVGKDPYIPER